MLFRHSANAVTEMKRKRNRGSLSSCHALASEISDFVSELDSDYIQYLCAFVKGTSGANMELLNFLVF